MSSKFALVLLILLALGANPVVAGTARDLSTPESDALEAYQAYWTAFNQFERNQRNKNKNLFDQKWETLKENFLTESAKLRADQLSKLEAALKEYKYHLDRFPTATNRPNVMLNYARVLTIVSDLHQDDGREQVSRFKKQEAIAVLLELRKSFPDFNDSEKAQYLLAISLSDLGIEEQSTAAWQDLARRASNSLYGVHAHIALGDRFFAHAKTKEALSQYKAGLALLLKIDVQNKDMETARIHYRSAWAAYRSGDLGSAILSATALLQPGLRTLSLEAAARMRQDSNEIIAEALYEQNEEPAVKNTFSQRALSGSIGAIAKTMALRYSASGIYRRVISTVNLALGANPTPPEAPELLALQAAAFAAENQPEERMSALERIAMLVPGDSLWRRKNKNVPTAIAKLDQIGKDAASAVATFHYESGIATGRYASFRSAASHFEILIGEFPTDANANTWLLRRAHCYLFTEKLEKAAQLYAELIQARRLDSDQLEMAAYQLAVSRERLWRRHFSNQPPGAENKSEKSDPLREFEIAADEFASRFPDIQRAVDLILMVASANRDENNLSRARNYWAKSLSMKPTPVQRATAIRGIVFATVKTGAPSDVVRETERFLRLENWKAVGQYVESELLGVLSSASQDEAQRLSQNSQIRDGGVLLVRIAQMFPRLPERARVYRDGAYMFGLASDWQAAYSASTAFLAQKIRPYDDDMTYLKARSAEYQMNFQEASTIYLSLARRFPKHGRALAALSRSERLSAAIDRTSEAGQAALLIGDLEPDRNRKLAAYERSADYFTASKLPTQASSAAVMYTRAASSDAERLHGQLLQARISIENNRNANRALERVHQVLKRATATRGRNLTDNEERHIAGGAHLVLAKESKRAFDEYEISQRSGPINERLAEKSRLFESLVQHYSAAANTNQPDIAPQARFELAEAAEIYARQISEIPARNSNGLSLKMRQRINDNVKRLEQLSRKNHTQNMLARAKSPAIYKNNEWILKSTRKLSDFGGTAPDARHPEELPAAISMEIPYQWSL